jgi:hypothetical protein
MGIKKQSFCKPGTSQIVPSLKIPDNSQSQKLFKKNSRNNLVDGKHGTSTTTHLASGPYSSTRSLNNQDNQIKANNLKKRTPSLVTPASDL